MSASRAGTTNYPRLTKMTSDEANFHQHYAYQFLKKRGVLGLQDRILGYEGTGIVQELGPETRELKQ